MAAKTVDLYAYQHFFQSADKMFYGKKLQYGHEYGRIMIQKAHFQHVVNNFYCKHLIFAKKSAKKLIKISLICIFNMSWAAHILADNLQF